MKRKVLAVFLALAVATPVMAGDWFEASAQFSEKVDGHLSPSLKVQGLNYVNNVGIGWQVGEGDAFGPVAYLRVIDYTWPSGWGVAVHLGANSNVGLPGTTEFGDNPRNLAYVFEPRIAYVKLNDLVELALPMQYTTIDKMTPQWTFGVSFVFRPSGLQGE